MVSERSMYASPTLHMNANRPVDHRLQQLQSARIASPPTFNRQDVVNAVKNGNPGRPGVPGQCYIAGSVVGNGRFGVTYQATHRRSGADCVVKMLSKEQAAQDQVDIQHEINILALLDHPHILRLFESYADELYVYLVVDLCCGGDVLAVVEAQIQSKQRLAEPWVARVFSQTLEALAYCHEKGVMHKDLKFDNLMLHKPVTADSPIQDIHVVLIDFGLAETFGPEHDKSTHSNVIAGTLFTMAPEVLARRFSYKCDVWGVGCLLFAILNLENGRDGLMYPFRPKPTAEDPLGTISMFESHRAGPPMQQLLAASQEVQQAVRLMLTFHEDARPSAKECLEMPWFDIACSEAKATMSEQQLHAIMDKTACGRNIWWPANPIDDVCPGSITRMDLVMALRKIWWAAISIHGVARLPAAKTVQLTELFKTINANNTGFISRAELASALRGLDLPENRAEHAFDTLDLDNSGTVEWSEFVAALLPASEDLFGTALEIVFQHLDTNEDGTLDHSEIMQHIGSVLAAKKSPPFIDSSFTAWIADILFSEIDTNGDGRVSRQEFEMFFLREFAPHCQEMSQETLALRSGDAYLFFPYRCGEQSIGANIAPLHPPTYANRWA